MGILVDAARERVLRALAPRASLPPVIATASVAQSQGRAMKTNVDQYRSWSRNSPWVRGAIDIRKDQIASADYEIGPYDVNKPYSKRLALRITQLFNHPNDVEKSFRALIEKVLDDLLTLDAGCIEGVETLRGDLVQLHPADAKWVRVAVDWDGGNPKEARYFWYPGGQYDGTSWKNSQFAYIMQNPTTYSPLGISPLEVLKWTIDAELASSDYNRRQVKGAAPEGLLHLGEGVTPDQREKFQSEWEVFQQTGGAMAIIAGGKNPNFTPFRNSNRDMQFSEWQVYLVRQIALVYGMSPQDLGLTFDINRSQGDVQAELSEDRGLRPLADLIEDELTHQFVWHPSFGGPENNLSFRFTRLNINESLDKASINKIATANVPWKRVNEARVDEGREPIGDLNDPGNAFNQILANTPLGLVRITEKASDIPTPVELAGMQSKTPASTNGQPPSAKPAPVAEGSEKENN